MKMLTATARHVRAAGLARAGSRMFGEHFVPADMPIVKRKWKAVEAVGNITGTMKNVAAGKLPSTERFLKKARPFAGGVLPFFQVDADPDPDQIKKILHIVIAPEKGLCGHIGTNTAKATQKAIQADTSDREHSVVSYGKKGTSRCKGMVKDKLKNGYTDVKTKNPTFNMVMESVSHILDRDFDKGIIHYNQYRNSTSYILQQENIYSNDICEKIAEAQFPGYDVEGDEATIIRNLLEYRTACAVYLGLAENIASENGARLGSMSGAVKACEERAIEYEKIFQSLRKTKITNELVVTSAGCKSIENAKKAQNA